MKDITEEEKFELCNVEKSDENIKTNLTNALIQNEISEKYRNEENDKLFKFILNNPYALFGFHYFLDWEHQTGQWLEIASNFLFNLPREIKGIILTDEELKLCCRFATICLNLNANNLRQFYNAFSSTFGDDIKILVDPSSNLQLYFYNPDKISVNVLKTLSLSHLLPNLLGYNNQWISYERPCVFFRDISIEPGDIYPHLERYYNDNGTIRDDIDEQIATFPFTPFSPLRDLQYEILPEIGFWRDYDSITLE